MVIVNPAAGAGRAAARWRALAETARRHLTFQEEWTGARGHATELAAAAVADGIRRILVIGGDGTLLEVANALAGTQVALGVLPMGTGNDFVRSAGITGKPEELLPRMAAGTTRAVDLGRVNGRYFMNVAGVGFDAEVARIVSEKPRHGNGTVPYLGTAIRQAFRYVPPEVAVTIDDGEAAPPSRRLMVAVGNGATYAGGMKVCPGAVLDDGVLDVLLVGDLRGFGLLKILGRVFNGSHLSDRRVQLVPARTLRIDGSSDVTLHTDGEVIGHLPAEFSVAPGALQLWVPGQTPA